MVMWMRVSKDKYRLPIAIADTAKELAKICNVPTSTIYSSWSHRKGCFIRIDIPDED